jgi:hypothetical protein
MMATCPNCGEWAAMTEHAAISTEPHGERHYDEWLTCTRCGADTTEDELADEVPFGPTTTDKESA